ncbi:MAG: hypothetical protein LBF58_06745 [Deltaproteobacteria bacterium]|jgi:hypothetical protein|nr:hypothetical protein [Deltaproteobacteria bacterium]
MSTPKLSAVILAIALFIVISPIYKMFDNSYGSNIGGNKRAKDNGNAEPIFFEGKYYDQKMAGALEPRFQAIVGLAGAERLAMRERVNGLFDGYAAGVDRFLDWFYGLGRGDGPAGVEAGRFLREGLALALRDNPGQRAFSEGLKALGDRHSDMAGKLAGLRADLALCEVPAGPAAAVAPAGGAWPWAVSRSQADLEALGRALEALGSGEFEVGPGSPLMAAISGLGSFVAAQNAIAYPAPDPDLGKLVSRQTFRAEILGAIDQGRQRALDAVHGHRAGPGNAGRFGPFVDGQAPIPPI